MLGLIACSEQTHEVEDASTAMHEQIPVDIVDGAAELDPLEKGKAADLSLLPEVEQQEIADAVARADSHRKGALAVRLGRPDVAVRLTQVGHGLRIGSAIDLASVGEEDLDWYKETFRKTFNAAHSAPELRRTPYTLTLRD
jgi:hypothetical protein